MSPIHSLTDDWLSNWLNNITVRVSRHHIYIVHSSFHPSTTPPAEIKQLFWCVAPLQVNRIPHSMTDSLSDCLIDSQTLPPGRYILVGYASTGVKNSITYSFTDSFSFSLNHSITYSHTRWLTLPSGCHVESRKHCTDRSLNPFLRLWHSSSAIPLNTLPLLSFSPPHTTSPLNL